jgi:hypothetical protein
MERCRFFRFLYVCKWSWNEPLPTFAVCFAQTFAMKVYKKAMMLEYGQGEHVQEESRLMTLIDNQFIAKIEVCCQDRQD